MKKNRILLILSALLIIVLTGIFLYQISVLGVSGLLENNNRQEELKKSEVLAEEPLKAEELPKYQFVEQAEVQQEGVNFLFFGDIMLDRHVAELIAKESLDQILQGLEEKQVELFEFQDIVSANLEGAVTESGEHYAPRNLYDFAFRPELVAKLKDYSFNYFTIANNHILDQGELGLKETRDNLEKMDFYFSGASDAQVNENSLTYLNVKDSKVAMLAFSMVYHHFNQQEALDLLAKAKSEADLVVLNIHWGTEYEHIFNSYQQEVAHALIDAGADIIIGHHPHVIQGMEVYNNKPIFYSLGNFIFDQYFSKSTQEGLAVAVEFRDEEVKIKLHPFVSHLSAPVFMNEAKTQALISEFKTWSHKNSQDLVGQEMIISLN